MQVIYLCLDYVQKVARLNPTTPPFGIVLIGDRYGSFYPTEDMPDCKAAVEAGAELVNGVCRCCQVPAFLFFLSFYASFKRNQLMALMFCVCMYVCGYLAMPKVDLGCQGHRHREWLSLGRIRTVLYRHETPNRNLPV